MSKKLLIFLLAVLFAVGQCTVLNYIQILQITPDLLLILVIFVSLYYGQIYGLGTGLLCGFLKELTCAVPCGIMVVTYAMGGLFWGYLARWIYPFLSLSEHIFINKRTGRHTLTLLGEACISFVFAFLIYLLSFFLFHAFQIRLPLFETLLSVILPASIYTACVAPFLLRFLKMLFNTG